MQIGRCRSSFSLLDTSETNHYTSDDSSRDETITSVGESPTGFGSAFSTRQLDTFEQDGDGFSTVTLHQEQNFNLHDDAPPVGTSTSRATVLAGSTFHQVTGTLDATQTNTVDGSSSQSQSMTVTTDGDSDADVTVDALTNFNMDGSTDGTVTTDSVTGDHTDYTLEGEIRESPGFVTTLDGYGHDHQDNTFDETVDFTQPADGERQETAQRHRDETTSQADVLTTEIGGSVASGWTSMSLDGRTYSNETFDRHLIEDETVEDGETTALSTWEESTELDANGGEFSISNDGSFSGADDSVSFAAMMDVDFDDSHRTHLVIEDGVETTHDELERHATGSSSTPANGPVGPKRSTG